MCRRKTCLPSPGTRGSIPPCRPGAPSGRPATSGTNSAVSMRARIRRTERSRSASRPRSSGSSLFGGRRTMNKQDWNRLLYGIAGVMLAAGVTYACSNFLDIPAQGTVEVASLETKAGVEGSLIAAYRSLDCSSSSVGSWACTASNWVWGSVPSGDAHKGSNLGDQAPIFEVETYLWSAGEVQDYLNQKWSQVYEGVSRANNALRLLAKVRAEKPGEIDDAEAAGIRGEAIFLRAHYHFEAYRMWQNIPYYTETDVDYKKSNVGVDVIGSLVRDLDTAAALLDVKPRNGEVSRATSWTAKAYKGRVYAYAASKTPVYWDSALATLD